MNPDIIILIAYVLLAIGFSFACSIAEAVLLSVTPSYIERLKETHPRRAALLKKVKNENIDQSLGAILTLNTIAHTVGAIGSGAKATAIFGDAWFGVFSAAMTLAILILSEIIPKTIGALHWARLAVPTAYFIRALITLLYPIVWVTQSITQTLTRGKKTEHFGREELLAMTRLGRESGSIDDDEEKLIHNLFKLRSLQASDVMTPRTVLFALPENLSIEEALEQIQEKPFSRIPVYESGPDRLTGFILRDDILLSKALGQQDRPIHYLKRPIHETSCNTRLSVLLKNLLKEHRHISSVIDEYGLSVGIVTLEDIVETLLGVEIMDEMDSVEDMQQLARQLWKKRAKTFGIVMESQEGDPEEHSPR